jgi:hypothetical protein
MTGAELSSEDAARFLSAVEDLPIVIDQAANALALLGHIMHGGDHDGHFGLACIAELTSRALGAAHAAHNETLVELGQHLQLSLPKGGKQ